MFLDLRLNRIMFMIGKNLIKNITRKLREKKLSISLAESCTGGMLSSAFTSESGSSKVFKMGLVTYSNQSKNLLLKVPKQIIKKHGAVSVQCCFSMVNNLSKISKSNIAVSITGIVYIGIKKGNKVKINRYLFKNKGRSSVQKAAV